MLVASDPLVLGAGGTTLDASHTTGAWIRETTWGLPDGSPGTGFQASGGGFSRLFRRPAYQNGVPGIGSMRGVPDVAADANPTPTRAASRHKQCRRRLHDQRARRHERQRAHLGWDNRPRRPVRRTPLGFVNPAFYEIARSSHYHGAFHDITAGHANSAQFPHGTITGYRAARGWDPVTGWGTPNAKMLVPLLARYARR